MLDYQTCVCACFLSLSSSWFGKHGWAGIALPSPCAPLLFAGRTHSGCGLCLLSAARWIDCLPCSCREERWPAAGMIGETSLATTLDGKVSLGDAILADGETTPTPNLADTSIPAPSSSKHAEPHSGPSTANLMIPTRHLIFSPTLTSPKP